MAWCAAVRREASAPVAPVSEPARLPQLDSLRSCDGDNSSIAVAIIDANALISFDSSARLLALACSSAFQGARFVTVKEVLEEVRAPNSRFSLSNLPYSLDCIDPSAEALQKVVRFARETGDLASLSDVDLKLLALTYMLEEQMYGSAHLQTRPAPICVAQVRGLHERDLPGWGSNVQNLEEWEQLSEEPDIMIEEDSHILALRKLSLNTSQKESNLSDNEHQSAIDQEGLMGPSHTDNLHDEQNIIMPAPQEEHSCSEIEKGKDSMTSLMLEGDHSESTEGVMCDIESSDKDWQKMEEQDVQDGDWHRAISRSTRRKHDKRAARAAMKNLSSTGEMENFDGHQAGTEVSQPLHSNSNAMCDSDIEFRDARDSILDEANPAPDGKVSDEDCLSTSETSVVEATRASQDSESEASWTLHSLSQSKVACITADFPMQNVLLQIGLRVVSPSGLQIQQLQRWVMKCEACRNVTSDVGRIFCPKCGNGGTLHKVSMTIGPNGIVQTGIKKRFNIRGTKYSIPLPKGGRQGFVENPILREDQLPRSMLHPKKKNTKHDFTSPAELFLTKREGKKEMKPPLRDALAIFNGKRNPNRPRSKRKG